MKQKKQSRQRKTSRRPKGASKAIQRMTAKEARRELYSEKWFQDLIGREVARRMNGQPDALPVLPAAIRSDST